MPLRHQQFNTALAALRKWGARWRRLGLACDLCGDLLVRGFFRNSSSLRLRIQGFAALSSCTALPERPASRLQLTSAALLHLHNLAKPAPCTQHIAFGLCSTSFSRSRKRANDSANTGTYMVALCGQQSGSQARTVTWEIKVGQFCASVARRDMHSPARTAADASCQTAPEMLRL